MIGCALFGYQFPFAGHGWRAQPEMMGLLCDTAKKEKEKAGDGEGRRRRGQTRKDRRNTVRENSDSALHNVRN